jgi:hypothetical protein
MTSDQILQLVAMIMVLVLVLPGFIYYTRNSSKSAILRNIAIWLGLAVVVAILYRTFG